MGTCIDPYTLNGVSHGPLSWSPLILVGSVPWAPPWYRPWGSEIYLIGILESRIRGSTFGSSWGVCERALPLTHRAMPLKYLGPESLNIGCLDPLGLRYPLYHPIEIIRPLKTLNHQHLFFVGYLEFLYKAIQQEPTKMMVSVVNGRVDLKDQMNHKIGGQRPDPTIIPIWHMDHKLF